MKIKEVSLRPMPGKFPDSDYLANSEGFYLCGIVCISISRGNGPNSFFYFRNENGDIL